MSAAKPIRAAIWVAALILAGPPLAAAAEADVVEQPRPFGYVLGDVLRQRILLQAQGQPFVPAAVPAPERVGVWLARRSASIDSVAGRRWLTVEYQLINAPQTLQTVNLPRLDIKSQDDTTVLSIPEWPISVNALTPRQAFSKGGLQDLRPDHAAAVIPVEQLQRTLELAASALAFTLLAWLGWWVFRSWHASAHQPFAKALRALRRSDEHRPEAWLALHRAFDETAGRAVHVDTLATLFQKARFLQAERAGVETFFSQSRERFFGLGAQVNGASAVPEAISLRRLCTALRRLEKRHER